MEIHRENTDLTLIQSVVEKPLSQHNSQSRIFAMMVLSNYLSKNQGNLKQCLKLTKEDIQLVGTLVKQETNDILSFLDQIRAVENNSSTLCLYGGLELLGNIIDSSEVEEDIKKAALLLEALLSEGTQSLSIN